MPSQKNYSVPVLLILYNRIGTSKKLIQIIKTLAPEKVYVSIDGPKKNDPTDYDKVQEVRDFVNDEFKEITDLKLNYHQNNLGCRFGPETAIDWFFCHESEGVILEDDCHPDLSFFSFSEKLLERYRLDKRVFAICGTNLLNPGGPTNSYYFSRLFMAWGWASWRDRWANYKETLENFHEWSNRPEIKSILPNKVANENLVQGARLSIENKIEAWDFIWHITCLLKNGLIVTPYNNMIKNVGFDDDATHNRGNYHLSVATKPFDEPINHPYIISPHENLDELSIRKVHGWYHLWEKLFSPTYLYAAFKIRIKSLLKLN